MSKSLFTNMGGSVQWFRTPQAAKLLKKKISKSQNRAKLITMENSISQVRTDWWHPPPLLRWGEIDCIAVWHGLIYCENTSDLHYFRTRWFLCEVHCLPNSEGNDINSLVFSHLPISTAGSHHLQQFLSQHTTEAKCRHSWLWSHHHPSSI